MSLKMLYLGILQPAFYFEDYGLDAIFHRVQKYIDGRGQISTYYHQGNPRYTDISGEYQIGQPTPPSLAETAIYPVYPIMVTLNFSSGQ